MLGYIVTVECQQNIESPDSTKSCPPLTDMLTLAIQHLNKCLSTSNIKSCTRTAGLRVFVHMDCFSTTELSQGYYHSAFCHHLIIS